MNSKLDVFEINRIFLEPDAPFLRLIPKGFKHTSISYCVIVSIFRILRNMLKILLFAPLKYKFSVVESFAHIYDGTILFRAPTLNNIRSMSSIIEEVKKERSNVKVVEDSLPYDAYPIFLMDIISLIRLPLFWKQFKNQNKDNRLIVNYNLTNFIYTPGVVWFYERILKYHRPECVILANDHTFITKPLLLLCEKYDIPCIYVQHASVSYAFPELRFSYSFLDGFDAFKKYACKGKYSKGNIILLGAARYDNLSKYRNGRNKQLRKCIGVSINKVDDNLIVDQMCSELLHNFPDWKIKIRSHPSMKQSPFIFTEKQRIIYTCATDESIIDYIDSIDVHIANDSGVHLDAILGGVRSIAYNMSRFPYGDNYQYVKNGLIYLAKDVSQVCLFVEESNFLASSVEAVRQYDESYEKNYEGNCQNIIAKFIINGVDMAWLKMNYKMKEAIYNNTVYYRVN